MIEDDGVTYLMELLTLRSSTQLTLVRILELPLRLLTECSIFIYVLKNRILCSNQIVL